ncbi:siderophore-interacting protein [Curtobacterium ammoniigenes]|uniref:siderophore-interacting protein n=1 Tax=Curtobacterium ammoniigenes TaxID=395387 RepID=UPI0008340107|nr:siderophore-interacting protein [Curtobacterium ammoniigenes]
MAIRYRSFSTRVAGIVRLSPHFLRLTLHGSELGALAVAGLDQRIKLILPVPGAGYADLPDGPGIWAAWRALPNARRNPLRTYTIRAYRELAGELDIDIVDHGPEGAASRWLAGAAPGEEVRFIGPERSDTADRTQSAAESPGVTFDRQHAGPLLLVGDETALPAIARIMADLPSATVGDAILEVPTASDRLPLAQTPGVRVQWAIRDGRPHGVALRRAISDWCMQHAGAAATPARTAGSPAAPTLDRRTVTRSASSADDTDAVPWDVPAPMHLGRRYAWVAGEAAVVRGIRADLRAAFRPGEATIACMGYWRHGTAET